MAKDVGMLFCPEVRNAEWGIFHAYIWTRGPQPIYLDFGMALCYAPGSEANMNYERDIIIPFCCRAGEEETTAPLLRLQCSLSPDRAQGDLAGINTGNG